MSITTNFIWILFFRGHYQVFWPAEGSMGLSPKRWEFKANISGCVFYFKCHIGVGILYSPSWDCYKLPCTIHTQIYDMNFFLSHHLNNGTPLIIMHNVKRVLYRYFPANWRLSRKVTIYAGLSYIQVNMINYSAELIHFWVFCLIYYILYSELSFH